VVEHQREAGRRLAGRAFAAGEERGLALRQRRPGAGGPRGIVQVGLDERDPGVGGYGVGQERTHPRPRAVGADEEVGGEPGPVRQGHLVSPTAERAHGGELRPPPDRVLRQRVQQEVPQPAAVHLGPATLAGVALLEQDGRVLVEDPDRLTAGVDQPPEPRAQTRCPQGDLARVVVDVEHAALGAGSPGRLEVEQRGVDPVHPQR
jgi:hypothetical protein